MNELAGRQDQLTDREGDRDPNSLAISDSTKELIKHGVSENTLALWSSVDQIGYLAIHCGQPA